MKRQLPIDDSISQGTFTRMVSAWNSFWFTPADPTVLGLIRLTCGLITLYTLFIYSFSLQEFMGAKAWYDLKLRMQVVRDRPQTADPLDGKTGVFVPPSNRAEEDYVGDYERKFKSNPPAPYPKTAAQKLEIEKYRLDWDIDMRSFGLHPPETNPQRKYLQSEEEQRAYLFAYTERWRVPPPSYPNSKQEDDEISDYMDRHGHDPRRLYSRGMPVSSLWFHVTDPTAMAIIHGLIVFVVFLFAIGFCTRITSALTWMMSLWYIHRNTVIVFGVDTMMVILLMYLTIGPSGAAYSVDRLIARWWSKNKATVINGWRALWRMPPLAADQIQPAEFSAHPQASITANFAIRLLQIHVCVIYMMAGLSKLQGTAWWNGTAVWGTLANFEFAPMQFPIYNWVLRQVGQTQWSLELFITGAGLFTLVFEIAYAFLIWRPSTRWLLLSGAILLHGFIGMFMGLKTFSLMMLVMNMGFVKSDEVRSVMASLRRLVGAGPSPASTPRPRSKFETTTTSRPLAETAGVGSNHVKEKK